MSIWHNFKEGHFNDRAIIFLAMFSTGLASLLYEVVLISVVTTVVGATEMSLAIVLSSFLLGLSLGALFGGFLVSKNISLLKILVGIEVLVAVFGFSFLSIISWFVSSGIPTHIIFWIMVFCLLIPTLLMGMEIPIAVKLLEDREHKNATGFVYFADTLGGVIGALLSGLLLIPVLGFHGAMFFGAILNVFTSLLLFRFGKKKMISYLIVLALIFLVPLVMFFNATHVLALLKLHFVDSFFSIGSYFYQIYYSEPVFSTNSPFQHIMVMKSPYYGTELYLNGQLQVSDKSSIFYHEFLTMPAIAAHPNPKRVLLIGGGDGGALHQLLKFNFSRIDHVDLDKAVINVSKEYLPMVHRGALDDDRAQLHVGDGRRFVQEQQDNSYDIIIIDLPQPDHLALAPLYSKEFYEEVYRVLDKDGIMVTQFTSPYYYLEGFSSAVKTIDSVFPYTEPYIVPGSLYGSLSYIIAGKIDPRNVRNEVSGVWYDATYHKDMFSMPKFMRSYLANNTMQISTDKNPIIHLYVQNNYFYKGVADDPKQGR